MSIQSRVLYWVGCDRPGCNVTSPDQDDDEGRAWDSRNQAISDAQEDGWTVTLAGEFFCEDCVTDDDRDSASLVSDVRGDTLPGLAP